MAKVVQTIVTVAAEVLVELGKRAVKHTRKQTPEEFLEDVARWDKNHMGIYGGNTKCLICEQEGVSGNDRCPGLPVTQQARKKLEEIRRRK